MKKLLLLGPLVLAATPVLAGFTISSAPNAFTFQWFEPAWSGSETVGFGNGTFNPGSTTNFNTDVVYQWTHWYRANIVDGISQPRNYQIVKFTDQFVNGPSDVTNWAYEVAPGTQPAIRWEFRTKLIGVSPTQCYIRVDWTAKDVQKGTTKAYDINFFPYLDLQTQPSPNISSDSVTWDPATQTIRQQGTNPAAPVLYVRAMGYPLDSYAAGPYSPLRASLASSSFASGLNNTVSMSPSDAAVAFCHRFRLEPTASISGSYAVGYNMIPPVPTRIRGTVALDQFGASHLGMPVTVKLYAPGSDTLLETSKGYLGTNGAFEVNSDIAGLVDVRIKLPQGLTTKIANVNLLAGQATQLSAFTMRNGDVDGDDIVSILDYLILSDKYETTNASFFWDGRPDLDGDGEVGILDYLILSERFDQEGE